MNIQINRDLAVPIYTQIVGQIQFGIVSGHLPFGAQLPSIRELAQKLVVAPMTVAQAYQELKERGLLEMRPGRGTFVAEFAVQPEASPGPNRHLQLRRMLRRTIAEAQSAGFSAEEIHETFSALLTDVGTLFANHHLLLFGLFPTALQAYADDLERHLATAHVVVEPVSFAALAEYPTNYQADLARAEALLVPLHQVHLLRDLLQKGGFEGEQPILGLSFALQPAVHERIAALPSDLSIGIVSHFPEFVNTMVHGVATVYPMRNPPLICLSTDADCLEEMRQSVQAIIYASGSEEALAALRCRLPADFPLIEYLHTPDQTSYQRICQLLAIDLPNSLV